ncbi:MAG: purine-nucleoside phosphorylase [Thermotogae bacterium]|nr:purine-nucleoside phosphorylase [Thermotogota bacterium]
MDITNYVERVERSVDYIESKLKKKPKIVIVLGSGLGKIADLLEDKIIIPYSNIPGFPISTAPGHKGELVVGDLHGKTVVAMSGRFHYYEGYSMKDVTFPIRVFQLLGVEYLFITNAAGALNPEFKIGRPMVIKDHINFMGTNPLIGPNVDKWGPRFPDMSVPYDPNLITLARTVSRDLGIKIHEGVYIAISGPCFETPAEMRMLRHLGADAVGMSTVPEVIVAKHGGMKVFGLSAITDMAVPEAVKKPLTAEEVLEVAEKTGEKMGAIIVEMVKRMDV